MEQSDRPEPRSCCAPSRAAGSGQRQVIDAVGRSSHDDVPLAGGAFQMGDAFGEGYPSDGEVPVHEVRLPPFRIDATAVTNRMFGAFVADTGYRTEAGQYGTRPPSSTCSLDAPAKDVLGAAKRAPWWLNVREADWAHLGGAG